jgi:hypothetical protein
MDMSAVQQFLSTTVTELAIKIIAAIAFWVIGRWLIGKVIGLMQAGMNRNNVDPTLTKYLGSIVAIALNIALVLGILGYFGIQTTSFAAMLAGAGVAIGAAWSGLLGNFAAGAFMLVLRPFKVGDFVTIGGVTGTVHELGLFGTTIDHARQRDDHRGQRQDLRRHDPELLGAAGAPRRTRGATGRQRGPAGSHRPLQGRGGEDPQRQHRQAARGQRARHQPRGAR